MIRPFDLRDVMLVRQLEEQGISLDSRAALTGKRRPLHDALLAFLIAGRGTPTLVMRDPTQRAFGQLRFSAGAPQARLVTLAAEPERDQEHIWSQMLDALTAEAGRGGAHTLLAEIDDSTPLFETLRRADFVVYTRQEIWRRRSPTTGSDDETLRLERPADQWQIQQLIGNTVPRLIQQIEPNCETGSGFVWAPGESLLAYASLCRGSQGAWVQFYLHPQAEEAAGDIVAGTVNRCDPSPDAPLYCCVRRYQEWLVRCLVENGFEPLGSQAVTVRHTTVRIGRPVHAFATVHDKGLEATSPVVRSNAEHLR